MTPASRSKGFVRMIRLARESLGRKLSDRKDAQDPQSGASLWEYGAQMRSPSRSTGPATRFDLSLSVQHVRSSCVVSRKCVVGALGTRHQDHG